MILLLTSLVFLFAVLALVIYIKEEQTVKTLLEREKKQKNRIYQIAVLKDIQDRIGYSLDIEKIMDVITGSLRNIIPHSTASSIIIKDKTLIFKTYAEETVSKVFIEQVKKSMLASLRELFVNIPDEIDERVFGVPLNDNPRPLGSFFHIPLVINDKVVGLINVSSLRPNLYKEDEMTILYQIAGQASNALSRFEQVLLAEKEKLSSMIASLADGVLMVDSKNNLLVINDTAKRFLNIDKENPSFFDVVGALPKDFDIVSKIESSASSNKPIHEKELNITDKTFEIYIHPLSNGRTSILLHNATTEKNLSHLKEDFTNMIVHELRAPLIAIKDSSELIISSRYNLDEEEKKQFLEIINRQSKILLDQIGSILDSAKLEAGKFTITKTKGDLSKVIKEEVATFLPPATKKQINLKADIPQDLPLIPFDATRISQVMNNLLSNSLKFTQEAGTIVVRVYYNPHSDKFVTVAVSDTGIGIPKEFQKNMFSKFSQAETTPQALANQGTGLGLYVVKGVVDAHGGAVNLESSPGKGTTISFTLPVES